MVGFIYRHPSTELGEFGSDYLTNLLEKLSLENKALVLLGDFHANLLKYDIDRNISNFLDLMYLSFLLPHTATPTRTTVASTILIDNIFNNNCSSPYNSGNLVITLSDHHAQFLIMENQPNLLISLKVKKKQDKLCRDFKETEKNKSIISEQLENVDWES